MTDRDPTLSTDADGDLRQECRHAGCRCLAEQGARFCSDRCAEREGSDRAPTGPCDCGHSTCH